MAASVIDSVPHQPDLAIGHSLGGLVLAVAITDLAPRSAIYEDPPWGTPPGPEVADFLDAQRSWTIDEMVAFHPKWPRTAIEEKRRALEVWDSATTVLVAEYPGVRHAPPPVPSLVIIGDTAPMIDDLLAQKLVAEGYDVRTITDTGHNVHNDDSEAFLSAIDTWL